MFIFCDFETKGFNGKIIDICALDEDKSIIDHLTTKDKISKKKIKLFFEKLFYDKNNIIIFWHPFMPIYLSHHYKYVFNKVLKGRYICFTNIYSFYDGIKYNRYKIANITKKLTGREHQDDALQDSIDLYDCFYILYNKIEIFKKILNSVNI